MQLDQDLINEIAGEFGLDPTGPVVAENAAAAIKLHGTPMTGWRRSMDYAGVDGFGRYDAEGYLRCLLRDEARTNEADDAEHARFQQDAFGEEYV